MKKETPRVLKEVSNNHNLDIIKPSMLFKTRMEKRIKSKKMNKDIVLEWKKMMVSIPVVYGNGGEKNERFAMFLINT